MNKYTFSHLKLIRLIIPQANILFFKTNKLIIMADFT